MAARQLLTSCAQGATPAAQRRREQAFLEAGLLDEIHLHVSTLAGDVLGIGAFHLDPVPTGPAGRHGVVWRRRTGGRAIASGAGFLVVTLGLPHRSALVAEQRFALKPEQVMNRCVRGLLAWLRKSGVDPVYPGLDMVTVARRALAHVSFAEAADGPTLFQAIVALDGSFATTQLLLDRLDPRGRIPARLVGASETSNLSERSRRWSAAALVELDLPAITAEIAAGYAEASGFEVAELDPGVTELLAAVTEDDAPAHRAVPEAASSITEQGILGPISAAAQVVAGRVRRFELSGDFIAPQWAVDALRTRIETGPASADAVVMAADSVLDGNRGYLLGLQPAALRQLLVRAVTQDQ